MFKHLRKCSNRESFRQGIPELMAQKAEGKVGQSKAIQFHNDQKD